MDLITTPPHILSVVDYFHACKQAVDTQISTTDFDDWLKEYTFQGLSGVNLARAFCIKFQLTDNLLWYTLSDSQEILNYIKKTYIK